MRSCRGLWVMSEVRLSSYAAVCSSGCRTNTKRRAMLFPPARVASSSPSESFLCRMRSASVKTLRQPVMKSTEPAAGQPTNDPLRCNMGNKTCRSLHFLHLRFRRNKKTLEILKTWLHPASRLRHQMECFTNTWDIFHISICEHRPKARGDGTNQISSLPV